jgi:hypothetical protein
MHRLHRLFWSRNCDAAHVGDTTETHDEHTSLFKSAHDDVDCCSSKLVHGAKTASAFLRFDIAFGNRLPRGASSLSRITIELNANIDSQMKNTWCYVRHSYHERIH